MIAVAILVNLALEDVPKLGGARVRAVGPGTPAAQAGIKVDDVIVEVDKTPISSGSKFAAYLETTKPKQVIKLTVKRGEDKNEFTIPLIRRPLDIVHPEHDTKPLDFVPPGKHDPFSLLMTLANA